MRDAVGKGNDVRKVMTHYRVNRSIYPPYRVLCDGTIMQVASTKGFDLKTAIPKLLGAPCALVVTRCILDELRALGNDFASAAAIAKRLPREPCAHGSSRKSSADCITALLERGNQSHLVLATKDYCVECTAREKGDFPVISIANQTRLVLRKPSTTSQTGQHPDNQVSSSSLSRADEAYLASNVPEPKRKLPVATRIRKRKRAKGPNPLSVKKSKKERIGSATSPASDPGSGTGEEPSVVLKRTRRRRRKQPRSDSTPKSNEVKL